jgi:hypothetical protein
MKALSHRKWNRARIFLCASSAAAQVTAATVGVATVGIGFYNIGVFTSGLFYAIPSNCE